MVLQAGSLNIELYEDDKLLSKTTLTYDKTPGSNNTLIIHGDESEESSKDKFVYGDSENYYKMKITAI